MYVGFLKNWDYLHQHIKKNIDFKEKELEVPCVAHVYQEDGLAHFIIIYKIKKNSVVIADPAVGIIEVDRKKFFNSEYGEDSPYFWTGVIILFQTTEEFIKKRKACGLQRINL